MAELVNQNKEKLLEIKRLCQMYVINAAAKAFEDDKEIKNELKQQLLELAC